jgi:hypothetical protein
MKLVMTTSIHIVYDRVREELGYLNWLVLGYGNIPNINMI